MSKKKGKGITSAKAEKPKQKEIEIVEVRETDLSEASQYIAKAKQFIGAALAVFQETEFAGSKYSQSLENTREELVWLLSQVEQVTNLRKALSSVQFTTKPSSDAKIVKKVIDVLQEKFALIPLDHSDIVDDDVVVIDDLPEAPEIQRPPTQVSTARTREETTSGTIEAISAAAELEQLRREASSEVRQEIVPARPMGPQGPPGHTVSPSTYERVFNQSETADFTDMPDLADLEDLTQGEIDAFMRSQGFDASTVARIEELRRLAPKRLDATPQKQLGQNASIIRRG